MKKALFMFMAMLFMGSVCFAEEAQMAPKRVATTTSKIVTGKVQSVSSGDTAKNLKPEITILDNMNKEEKVVVTPATAISDKEGNTITLNKVTNGENVIVRYKTTPEGTKEALTIKTVT